MIEALQHDVGFNSNWVSVPGETIVDRLDEYAMSTEEFSEMIGKSCSFVNKLIRGHEPITEEIACLLEESIGSSKEFWLSREAQYRKDSIRLEIKSPHEEELDWLKQLPISDMRKYGWVNLSNKKEDKIIECLNFFGVSSIEEWKNTYKSSIELAAFRSSDTFDSNMTSVSAWYRQGEVLSKKIVCAPWNGDLFKKNLIEIRKLTRKKSPKTFLPELKNLCAECGVAIAFVRAPKGCRASGVTRFVSKDRALIILSFRHLSDDHFWFTFFHEAGHLLLHGKGGMHLDDGKAASKDTNREEEEANDFSAKVLIPDEFQSELLSLKTNIETLPRFAKKVGVSSGIIVGQLQHMGILERKDKNWFKKKFNWNELDEAIALASE